MTLANGSPINVSPFCRIKTISVTVFAPPLVQSWNKVKLVKMVPGLIHHTLATINTEIAGGGGGESGQTMGSRNIRTSARISRLQLDRHESGFVWLLYSFVYKCKVNDKVWIYFLLSVTRRRALDQRRGRVTAGSLTGLRHRLNPAQDRGSKSGTRRGRRCE